MIDAVRQWILTMTGTAAFSALALAIVPESGAKRVVRFVCGLGIVTAMLSLSLDFEWEAYSRSLAEYRREGARYAAEGENLAMEQTRAFIETECEAYIATKGREHGAELSAQVTAQWSEEGYWYPVRAVIGGTAPQDARYAVTEGIEQELGIPAQQQTWETEDGAG